MLNLLARAGLRTPGSQSRAFLVDFVQRLHKEVTAGQLDKNYGSSEYLQLRSLVVFLGE